MLEIAKAKTAFPIWRYHFRLYRSGSEVIGTSMLATRGCLPFNVSTLRCQRMQWKPLSLHCAFYRGNQIGIDATFEYVPKSAQ